MDETEKLLKAVTEAHGVPGYETEVRALLRQYLEPLGDLKQETVTSTSQDVGRAFGELEVNGRLFGSIVDDAIQTQLAGDRLRLMNADGPTRTWGGELLARWHAEPFHVTAT